MRKIILIVLIISSFYSCKNNLEQMLTDYNWEIEKVVDVKTGTINQTKANQEKMWDFRIDNTYIYETKNGNQKNRINGEWNLNSYNLQIINEFDSTFVIIEKITDNEMVWLIKNDSIRFYLNSKAKLVAVPDFANVNK